jgi:hypothetical protein
MVDPKRQAGSKQAERAGKTDANADPSNNLGHGSPVNREDRIRQRAREIWERAGRPEGQAQQHWDEAAREVDQEDLQREQRGG